MMKLTKSHTVLLIGLIYFTFLGGTFYSQLNFALRIVNQMVVTAILGGWLLVKLIKQEGLPRTPLDLALVLYLLVNLVSALWGQSPRFSLEAMWFSVIHVLAFYVLVDLMRRGWLAKLTWAFYMASAVVCVVGLAEFLAWYIGAPALPNFAQGWLDIGGWQQPIPSQIYRLAITLNGPTPLSAYLALLTPPAIGLVLTLPPRSQTRQALLIWLGLALLVQILTFSRAGVLALSVSLALTAVGWYKITGQKVVQVSAFWSRLNLGGRVILGLGGLLSGGGLLWWLQSTFANRAGSSEFRFVLWQTAFRLFQEHWLTGVGPANFGRGLLRLNETTLPRLQIATAHSIYLNTAAELGLLGVLVGVYLLVMVGRSWRQRWLQVDTPAERLRLAACGAALAGLAAQTLVDTYTATPNMLIMLALAAYCVAPLNPSRRRRLGVVYLLVLSLYTAALAWLGWADFHFWNSFRQENKGNLNGAVVEAAQSYRLDPYLPLRVFRLALLETRLAQQTGDAAVRQAAIEHYRLGLQQEPIWGLNSANLAGLLWQQGERQAAIDMLRQTLVAEEAPLYLVNLGYFYEQQANWPESAVAYGRALYLSPDLADSEFWRASPNRAEKWPTFVNAAAQSFAPDQAALKKSWQVQLALNLDDFDTAAALVEPALVSDAVTRQVMVELYLRRQQPAQARVWLNPAPQTPEDYCLEGRVNLVLHDEPTAEKSLKTAIFLGSREAYYYLGQLRQQQGNLPAAAQAYRQGFLPYSSPENIEVTIYDRLGGNDLAPQLLDIGVGPRRAAPWLALARLYEAQLRFDDAKYIYRVLLTQDPFLKAAHTRLDELLRKHSP